MSLNNEDFFDSCKSIVKFLAEENDPKIREIKYNDFKHKFAFLESEKGITTITLENVDVIVFCIIDAEFKALDKIFEIKKNGKKRNIENTGLDFWELEIEQTNGTKLKTLFVQTGEAGEINCSIVCMRFFQAFQCKLAILTGIAAGHEEEITKYGVVISESVVDYETSRMNILIKKDGKENELKKAIEYFNTSIPAQEGLRIDMQFRTKTYNPNVVIRRLFNHVISEQAEWKKLYIKELKKFDIDGKEFPLKQIDEAVIKPGVIASGKKLIANQEFLEFLRRNIPINKGIIAAEMEGAGFCPTCEEFDKKYIVVRGISDFGGEDKNDKKINQKYQFVAAVGAGSAIKYFLLNEYQTPTEITSL